MKTTAMRLPSGVRELFLLREAERQSTARTPEQRAALRGHHRAGLRRWQAARDLAASHQLAAALILYRDAVKLLGRALVASQRRDLDSAALSDAQVLEEVERALPSSNDPTAPLESAALRWTALASETLAPDRSSAEDQGARARALELVATRLAGSIDDRSPREIRVARWVRSALALGLAVSALTYAVLRLTAPRNWALQKPVTSSSRAWGTTPEGAVDGARGQYDFHSAEEASPWLSIDLGQKFALTRVKVYGRSDGIYDQSIPLALEVSTDGATYREIAERTTPFSDFNPWVYKGVGIVGRFVRLRTKRPSVLVVNEVEVNGRPAP